MEWHKLDMKENPSFLHSKVLQEDQIQMSNFRMINFLLRQIIRLLLLHKNYSKMYRNFYKKVYNIKNFLILIMKALSL